MGHRLLIFFISWVSVQAFCAQPIKPENKKKFSKTSCSEYLPLLGFVAGIGAASAIHYMGRRNIEETLEEGEPDIPEVYSNEDDALESFSYDIETYTPKTDPKTQAKTKPKPKSIKEIWNGNIPLWIDPDTGNLKMWRTLSLDDEDEKWLAEKLKRGGLTATKPLVVGAKKHCGGCISYEKKIKERGYGDKVSMADLDLLRYLSLRRALTDAFITTIPNTFFMDMDGNIAYETGHDALEYIDPNYEKD